MDAYIYQAELYCAECGARIRAELDQAGEAPEHPDQESTYDSDAYPKGPYPDGGGESDTPDHCASCHKFLENPLTQEGYAYVKETLDESGFYSNLNDIEKTWANFYDFTYKGWTSPEYDD